MTKEETVEKTDVTTEVTEEVEAPEPVETEEVEATTPKEEEIDYEAIEKEEAERKPNSDKAKEAFKERQAKRDETEEVEEEKPLTESRLKDILAQNNAQTQKTLTQNSAMEKARQMSSSEAEAKAIVATWNNRIFPEDMPIGQQIEEMYVAVNRKQIIAQNGELKRALISRDSVSRDSASTHKDAPQGSEPKLSSADAQGYASAGLKWDGKKRLYSKVLPNKKVMYKDPKSGNTWVA